MKAIHNSSGIWSYLLNRIRSSKAAEIPKGFATFSLSSFSICEPEISEVTFNITTASELSQNTLVVIFEVQAFIAFYYFLPHYEYALMSDEELTKISIEDAEWNEYVMRVLSVGEIELKFRLPFDTTHNVVES